MQLCDLTLPTPAENLACDEALLDLCEAGDAEELLRFWEPEQYFVVVGYANRVGTEVNVDYCRRHDIPVLRRCSGGGTVFQGPGCINYSVVLRIGRDPRLEGISGTNHYILERNREALTGLLGAPVELKGHTDLVLGSLKFSGNAQRRRKDFILFHGTFLLDMDIQLIEKALPMPSQQPGYRTDRSHKDFLVNLKLPPGAVKTALAKIWAVDGSQSSIPRKEIARLCQERYSRDEWNLKF